MYSRVWYYRKNSLGIIAYPFGILFQVLLVTGRETHDRIASIVVVAIPHYLYL